MKYSLEVLKVISGAVDGNREQVQAFANQLADRLDADGDHRGAMRIRSILKNSKLARLAVRPAKMTTAPIDSESKMSLVDEYWPDSDWQRPVFPKEVDERISMFVASVTQMDRLRKEGLNALPSMLLYGAPGTGKTMAAKAIAADLKLPLVVARADAMMSSFLGRTSKNLRLVFDYVRSFPCVFFLDEFDSLGKLRDDSRELGELKRVVVSLLQNLDASGADTILLAATNHPHLLDPAIWRRFSTKLEISLPGRNERSRILETELGNQLSERDIALLTKVTEGMSGSDLKTASDASKRSAVLSNQTIDINTVFREVIWLLKPEVFRTDLDDIDRVKLLRGFAGGTVPYRTISALLGFSVGKISQLTKEI